MEASPLLQRCVAGALFSCGCVVYRLTFFSQAAKQECRLELRFRPEDSLCKPVFAKPEKVTNLVFKIRKRRIKQSSDMNQPTAQPLFEYDVHVLGIVDTQFEFTGELPKSILDCITVML